MPEKYYDFAAISKGLFILGAITIVSFLLFFLLSTFVYAESSWKFFSLHRIAPFALTISLFLIVFGGIFYIVHRQFVKLARVAEDVESGRYDEEYDEENEGEYEENDVEGTEQI